MIMKGTLLHCCHLIFTLYSNFTNSLNNIVYSQKIQLKTMHHIRLSCFQRHSTVSHLSLTSMTLTLEDHRPPSFRGPPSWICLIFSHVTHLGQECYGNVSAFFSVHLIRCCMIAMSPINDNTNLGNLIKVASARLIHYEVTPLPLCN